MIGGAIRLDLDLGRARDAEAVSAALGEGALRVLGHVLEALELGTRVERVVAARGRRRRGLRRRFLIRKILLQRLLVDRGRRRRTSDIVRRRSRGRGRRARPRRRRALWRFSALVGARAR